MTKSDRKVALAVCGSIAAYKAVMVARELVGHGVAVTPIMTESATHFVGPLTLSGICGRAVVRNIAGGLFAMAVTFAIGSALGTQIG